MEKRCDGFPDCNGGEDETNCRRPEEEEHHGSPHDNSEDDYKDEDVAPLPMVVVPPESGESTSATKKYTERV